MPKGCVDNIFFLRLLLKVIKRLISFISFKALMVSFNFTKLVMTYSTGMKINILFLFLFFRK